MIEERASSMRKTAIYTIVISLFLFVFLTRFIWIMSTQPLSSFASIEEQFFDSIAARNFLNFGFLKTLFLPDYVSSRFVEDHPVVYTHMPPLEALIPGIFVKLSLGIVGARIFYIIINTLGFLYAYLFFSRSLNRLVSLFIVFFAANNFNNSFVISDHFNHGLAVFFIFGAAFHFLCLDRKYPEKMRNFNHAALFFLTISTSLTSYYAFIAQLTFIAFLYLFNFSRPYKKTFYLVATAIFTGIFVHILQNYLFLGGNIFFQDLILTLKNRIFGRPTTREMTYFFNKANIVCWGAPFFSIPSFLNTLTFMLQNQFEYLAKDKAVAGLFCLNLPINLIILLLAREIRDFIKFLKIIISIGISGISFALVFPALAQGYPIDIFFGMSQALAMAFLVSPVTLQKKARLYMLSLAIFICIALSFFYKNMNEFINAIKYEKTNSTYRQFAKLKKYSNEVIWTNLTYSYISYFVNNVVAGRCTLEAVKNKNLDLCDNVLINSNSPNKKLLKSPTIFIFSKGHLSGNMACGTAEALDAFENYLQTNYKLIEKVDDISVFRISD